MHPFIRKARADAAWHPVGLASSFPDLGSDDNGSRIAPRCKAFRIPESDGLSEPEATVETDIDLPEDLKDQVLIFKYKGNFHAVNHVSEASDDGSSVKPTTADPSLPSNARTRRFPFRRAASLTLRTLASSSAPASHAPSTAGPLISSLGNQIAAATSSRCGKCNCAIPQHRPMSLLRVTIRRFGCGENSVSAEVARFNQTKPAFYDFVQAIREQIA